MPLYGVTLGYITSVLRVYQVSKYETKLKIVGFLMSLTIIVVIWCVIIVFYMYDVFTSVRTNECTMCHCDGYI